MRMGLVLSEFSGLTLARLFVASVVLSLATLSVQAEEDEPAAILLQPGDDIPPFVTLEPNQPAVPWDVDHVAPFQLVDQDGNPVTRESLLGKPWIANFVFTRCAYQCPQTCRKIMELNQEVQRADVRFVTITVDPEHDRPEIMKQFAEIWGANPGRWIFATGEPDDVWELIRSGFKVSAWENVGTERQPGMEFAHSNHLIHVDAEGKILGRYDSGVDAEMVTLRRVINGDIETPKKHQPATIDALKRLEELGQRDAAVDPMTKLPVWAQRLPATNAMLNGLATLLLLTGFAAIKGGRTNLHRQLMLTAFGVSVLFLASYLTYHWALHHYAGIRGKPYSGPSNLRTIYYGILVSHVVLAALVPVLAIITIRNGLQARWTAHRRWAKVTFPIWLYVSVTGVIIYWMLYRI